MHRERRAAFTLIELLVYSYWAGPFPQTGQGIYMGGKPYAILREPSRRPMLSELPNGFTFTA